MEDLRLRRLRWSARWVGVGAPEVVSGLDDVPMERIAQATNEH